MKLNRRLFTGAVAALAMMATAAPLAAQNFPERPITIIVPLPPGSSTEMVARTVGSAAEKALGQPVVIDFKPGGNMAIGANAVKLAEPDGYTLGIFIAGQILTQHMQQTEYDVLKDFDYITSLVSLPNAIAVRADSPYKTLGDLLEAAKARPGEIPIAHAGVGTGGQIIADQIKRRLGITFREIPYKGAEYIQALLGGDVQALFSAVAWGPLVEAGDLHFQTVLGDARLPNWPDVPTAKEQGFDIAYSSRIALAAPAGLDPAVLKRLEEAFMAAAQTPEFAEVMAKYSMLPWSLNSAELRAWVESDYEESKVLAEAIKAASGK